MLFYQPHGSDPNSSWLKMRLDGSETQAARLRRWSYGGTQSHASFSVAFVQPPTCGPTDRVKKKKQSYQGQQRKKGCECPAEAGARMWQQIHGNYKESKTDLLLFNKSWIRLFLKLSDFTFILSTSGWLHERKVVIWSLRRQQPLSSQSLRSHLEMKVSVGGWKEWAPRDHQAARRGAEADVKYIIRQGVGNGCATEICSQRLLQLQLGPETVSPQRVRPSLELPVHLGSTAVCYSSAQRCCHRIGEDWCRFRGTASAAKAETTACLPLIPYSRSKRWVDVLLIPCHVMDVFTRWFIYMYDFKITSQRDAPYSFHIQH